MNAYTTDSMTIKLLGKKCTVHRLLRNGEVIGVYETKAEAEAARAAL